MKTKILIATHKLESVVDNEIFRPVQVGSAINQYTINKSYIKDNTGDNISDKNSTFNELTAIYWAWKNLKDEEVFGLMHYRRFLNLFYTKPFYKNVKKDIMKQVKSDNKKLLKLNNVKQVTQKTDALLAKYDIITANPIYCSLNKKPISIAEDYIEYHLVEDWNICMDVIKEHFPEYKKSIETHLYKGNQLYYGNIFIAKKEWFDAFCHWLFTILFEVEKRITLSEDPYQKRVIGFLSERLFTLYVLHHQFKIKSYPIFYVED